MPAVTRAPIVIAGVPLGPLHRGWSKADGHHCNQGEFRYGIPAPHPREHGSGVRLGGRVFHTFWGLDILHAEKSKSLQLSAVGNPNMPVPNIVAALPGMDRFATRKMEQLIEEHGTPTIEELIELSFDQGVELQACQMTMELMGYEERDMYAGVTTGVGAATALEFMGDAEIQLLI